MDDEAKTTLRNAADVIEMTALDLGLDRLPVDSFGNPYASTHASETGEWLDIHNLVRKLREMIE